MNELPQKLKNPLVYEYPTTDFTKRVVVVFTTESGKNYKEIVEELPKNAELFEIIVSDNILC